MVGSKNSFAEYLPKNLENDLTWLPRFPILCMTRHVKTAKHSTVLKIPDIEKRAVIIPKYFEFYHYLCFNGDAVSQNSHNVRDKTDNKQ